MSEKKKLKETILKDYFKNGSIKSEITETEYRDGLKTKTWKNYHKNGKLKDMFERELDENGKVKEYPVKSTYHYYDKKGRKVKTTVEIDNGVGLKEKIETMFDPKTGEILGRHPIQEANVLH